MASLASSSRSRRKPAGTRRRRRPGYRKRSFTKMSPSRSSRKRSRRTRRRRRSSPKLEAGSCGPKGRRTRIEDWSRGQRRCHRELLDRVRRAVDCQSAEVGNRPWIVNPRRSAIVNRRTCQNQSVAAQILDGLALSREVRAELKDRVDALRAKGITPRLDVLVAAQDPASLSYVRMKRKWADAAGILSGSYEVTEETTQAELIAQIRE